MTNRDGERRAWVTDGVQRAALAMLLALVAIAGPAGAQAQGAATSQAQLEKNKAVVINFYKALFDEKDVAGAFKKYASPTYIQHSPLADDIPATIAFLQNLVDSLPEHGWELKRVIAEGDLVVLHVHSWNVPADPGRAIAEIFRVENGLVAEHWEIIQTVVQMEGRSMF